MLLAAGSCALPEFDKVESDPSAAKNRDAGPDAEIEPDPEPTPSCPMEIGLTGACRSCVAEHCCRAARACDDDKCGADISLPISPVTTVTPEFDALASCIRDNCDTEDTCDLSWGCVGKYKWPTLREQHSFNMRVFNYADPNESGIPNVKVRLCESSDPRCLDDVGYVTTSTTDSSGVADFTVPRGFNGYFQLDGGGPQPATVQWSKPVYNVVDSFNHQALHPNAVDGLAQTVELHSGPGQPFAAGTGHLIARMQSCLPLRYLEMKELDARARDVQFAFTPQGGASPMYYVNDMATLDRELDRTSSRGYAGAFEVQATNVTVTAKHAFSGKMLATGTLAIREGTIGFMYLVPRTAD